MQSKVDGLLGRYWLVFDANEPANLLLMYLRNCDNYRECQTKNVIVAGACMFCSVRLKYVLEQSNMFMKNFIHLKFANYDKIRWQLKVYDVFRCPRDVVIDRMLRMYVCCEEEKMLKSPWIMDGLVDFVHVKERINDEDKFVLFGRGLHAFLKTLCMGASDFSILDPSKSGKADVLWQMICDEIGLLNVCRCVQQNVYDCLLTGLHHNAMLWVVMWELIFPHILWFDENEFPMVWDGVRLVVNRLKKKCSRSLIDVWQPCFSNSDWSLYSVMIPFVEKDLDETFFRSIYGGDRLIRHVPMEGRRGVSQVSVGGACEICKKCLCLNMFWNGDYLNRRRNWLLSEDAKRIMGDDLKMISLERPFGDWLLMEVKMWKALQVCGTFCSCSVVDEDVYCFAWLFNDENIL